MATVSSPFNLNLFCNDFILLLKLDFCDEKFFTADNEPYENENDEIIEKFYAITGIKERRYIDDDMFNSDMATSAAKIAIENAPCEVARPGEMTYECRVDRLCRVCVWRNEALIQWETHAPG